jgi:hypothetical protein
MYELLSAKKDKLPLQKEIFYYLEALKNERAQMSTLITNGIDLLSSTTG